MMKLILVAFACYFTGAYAGMLMLMSPVKVPVVGGDETEAGSGDTMPAGGDSMPAGGSAVPEGGNAVENQTPEQAAAIFADDDDAEDVNDFIAEEDKKYKLLLAARAFVGLRGSYCYTSIGSGIMSRTKCFPENPLKNRKCPTLSCAYRPTFAIYKNIYAFRALQTPYMQQSVGAKLCKEPGQVCGCKSKCSNNLSMANCKRRRTCQNKYGWEDHRIIIIVPMKDAPPQYRRVWTKVKVSVACDCVN